MTTLTADRTIEIAGNRFDVLDHPQYGTTCLFPIGKGRSLLDDYEDDADLDVVMQSAPYFLIAEDGNFGAAEDANQKPYLITLNGVIPAYDGQRWEDPNGEDLIATRYGWRPEDESAELVRCEGAPL